MLSIFVFITVTKLHKPLCTRFQQFSFQILIQCWVGSQKFRKWRWDLKNIYFIQEISSILGNRGIPGGLPFRRLANQLRSRPSVMTCVVAFSFSNSDSSSFSSLMSSSMTDLYLPGAHQIFIPQLHVIFAAIRSSDRVSHWTAMRVTREHATWISRQPRNFANDKCASNAIRTLSTTASDRAKTYSTSSSGFAQSKPSRLVPFF